MAIGGKIRACTVILHDDRVSQKDVLGGTDVLPVGAVAQLSSNSARPIIIIADERAAGQKEVSLHVTLGARFGFEHRRPGRLSMVEDEDDVTATHIEFSVRDRHIARADRWQLAKHIEGQVLYENSKISYLGLPVGTVQSLHLAGNRVTSALIRQPHTKAIIRSNSARFTILIQISKEMLENWHDGELMYEILVDGYLTELFHRWEAGRMRHLVSVIIFGREIEMRGDDDQHAAKDFYWVLFMNQLASRWQEILKSLRRVFNEATFCRGVSRAADGSLVESIQRCTMDTLQSYESPTLTSTGGSIIVVTAGAGLFNANHVSLKDTTFALLGNNICIDIVSLAPRPSHPVPLFRYQLDNNVEYALPHWADISYWTPTSQLPIASRWIVEGSHSTSDVEIPFLSNIHSSITLPKSHAELELFDATTFGPSTVSTLKSPIANIVAPESTSAQLSKTVKTASIYNERQFKPTSPFPPLKQRPSSSSIATTISLNSQVKSPSLSALTGRKISVGPRGLAPMRSSASTTLSATHASHGKEVQIQPVFSPNEASSGLAKQIRASLNRKRSDSNLSTHTVVSSLQELSTTRPIDIHQKPSASTDASLDDTDTAQTDAGDQLHPSKASSSTGSPSKTPKAFVGLASSPEKARSNPSVDALTPWLTLLNPCNVKRSNMRIANQYRQWQHVFPRHIASGEFNWAAMCSPASLPLHNDLYPSPVDLKTHYRRSTRRIVCSPSINNGKRPRELMEQLIMLRLTYGFQIVAKSIHSEQTHIFLSIGTDYHELQCLSDLELEVVEYVHRPLEPVLAATAEEKRAIPCKVTPLYAESSMEVSMSINNDCLRIDWAAMDARIESHHHTDSIFRVRFILLPVEQQKGERSGNVSQRDLSDDERRIDGIQRLTQQWQRHRFFSAEDQSHQVSITRRRVPYAEDEVDQNPLAIEYHTLDPSAVVNSQETEITGPTMGGGVPFPLFLESERYHSGNFDIARLVRQMQEAPPHGVEVRDRRWLARLHLKCFRGDEMTNWLLGAFKDLHTREDAVDMGNELMKREIFTHVLHKHGFRDGNYFYQIAAPHRTHEYPDTASFFNRVTNRAVPLNPSAETRMSPVVRPARGDSDSSGDTSVSTAERKRVLLSEVLRYDVDPAKKSNQEQVMNLHYGRLHNPENCYHIHIDWLLTSPILIREAVVRWTMLVESYGLRLVQVPLLEASKHSERYPLEQPQYVRLALEPPDRTPLTPRLSTANSTPRGMEDKQFYHKAILRQLGFVLDYESADSYSSKFDVVYSWGQLDFEMTQFVHQSGLILAQISTHKDWDFLLLPNSLAAQPGHYLGKVDVKDSAEEILKSVKSLARDRKALREIYDETSRPRLPAPSPSERALLANADMDVPPMQLPPHLLHRGV